MDIEKLKFPIGRFLKPSIITSEIKKDWMDTISYFPEKLISETAHLNDEQLNTRYRPQGWTIRQVVHHCADSHMNSLIRFKLALTEHEPAIKPYEEQLWAELADTKSMPIQPSLKMLEGIHQRWTILLNSLSESDNARVFVHPEHGTKISIEENIGIYAWHCSHHLAHITTTKETHHWK